MFGRKLFDSIFFRLLLIGAGLALVALIGRFYVLSHFLREDITQVVSRQQLSLATYAAKDIDHSISLRQDFLQRLAATLPLTTLQRPAELTRWVASVQATQTLFSAGLLITDEQGRPLTRAHIGPLDDTRALLTAEALETLAQGKVHVGAPTRPEDRSRSAIPMMARVAGLQGQTAVLIGLTFLSDQDFLGNLMHSRIGQSSAGFLLISPQDQLFIASSQPDMVLKPTPPPGVNPLHDKAMAGYRGVGVTVNARGIEEISAMVTVPSTGWFVVARIPTSEALVTVTHARDFMFRNAFFTMAVFLTIFATALYYLLRPLMRATAQADKMSQGLVPMEPLQVHGGHNEVGTLIAAFNRLLRKLNEQNTALTEAAHHDALTGLPNRLLLADRLQQALAQAARHQTRVALLFLDLDMFKPINDTLGHEAGDKVLQEVARRLLVVVRATDSVARIGGDEFVVLLGELATPARPACERVAQEIITALSQPIEVAGTRQQIGVSIGCIIASHHSTPHALLIRADNLMYQAKAQGRGRCVIEEEIDGPALAGA